MFNIISIGDSVFLTEVLKSLAMICATDDFIAMSKVAILVGVLGVCVSAVINAGKGVDFHHILVAYLIWACMFGPKVTVNIEDKYSGTVTVVANVPVGPAAAGTLISTMGEGLNSLFEVGYSPIIPGLSQSAFLDSLKLLNNTRRIGSMNTLMMAVNADSASANGTDIRFSWYNYIKDCSLKKISVGLMSHDELMSLPYETALKFNTPLYTTLVAINGAKEMGCDAAFDEINNNTKIGTETYKALAAALALNSTNMSAGDTSEDALNNAISVMLNASISAQQFVKLSLLESIMNSAVEGRYQDTLDTSSALAVNQAIQQRNSDWAASQGVFMTTVRPMMAFLEAFIYAITPIMAFVILLGSMGLKLAMKYFMLILWIQLWYPILSIINLYIYTVSRREILEHDGLATFNWDSFYAVHTSTEIMSTWIATGGLLATTTPAIALFLVSGTAVAFTSLSGKLQGSDHLNEKMMTPDAHSAPPLLSTNSMMTGSTYTGGQAATGSPADSSTISMVTGGASLVAATSGASRTASTTFGDTLGNTTTSGTSQTLTDSRAAMTTQAIAATGNKALQSSYNQAQKIMKDSGMSQTEMNSVNADLGAQLAATGTMDAGKAIQNLAKATPKGAATAALIGLAGKLSAANTSQSTPESVTEGQAGSDNKPKKGEGGNSSFKVQGSAQVTTGVNTKQSLADQQQTSTTTGLSKVVNLSEAEQAAFSKSTAAQIAESEVFANAALRGDQQAAALVRSAQDVVQTSNAHNETSSRSTARNSGVTVKTADVAASSSPEMNSAVKMLTDRGDGAELQEKTSFHQQMSNMPHQQAQNMAAIEMLQNPRIDPNSTPTQQAEIANQNSAALQGILSAYTGTNVPSTGDSYANQGVATGSGAPIPGGAMTSVNTGLVPVETTSLDQPASNFTEKQSNAVWGAFEKYTGDVNEANSGQNGKLASPEAAKETLHNAANNHGPAMAFRIGAALDGVQEQLAGGGAGAVEAAKSAWASGTGFVQAMSNPEAAAEIKTGLENAKTERNDAVFNDFGAAALPVVGAATAAETALGASQSLVVNGMALLAGGKWEEYANGFNTLSLQQAGQAMLAGSVVAAESGIEGYQAYMQASNEAMYERGIASGLTPAQAQVFANNFAGGGKDEVALDALRQEVNSYYANPEDQEQVYSDLVSTLGNASWAGREGEGEKFLVGVSMYNDMNAPGRTLK
jgi:conjugal transfer mating pair stabilization protein TraG